VEEEALYTIAGFSLEISPNSQQTAQGLKKALLYPLWGETMASPTEISPRPTSLY
jgi:hypothetical protein